MNLQISAVTLITWWLIIMVVVQNGCFCHDIFPAATRLAFSVMLLALLVVMLLTLKHCRDSKK
jgi:hypothetical protein